MAPSSKDLLVAVSYSLPHVVSASVGVLVAGYLGLLYINTYKWHPKQFGTVYSFYFLSISVSQFIIALLLQFVGTTADEIIGLRNCKIAQVVNISAHSISFFLLLFLPLLKLKHDNNKADLQNKLEASRTHSGLGNSESKNEQNQQESTSFTRFLESKYFYYVIYLCAIVHGYGWGCYEICDRLLPTYMTKDASYLSSTNDAIRGFFMSAPPLIVMVYNKFAAKKRPDYTVHLTFAVVLLVILVPISVLFFLYTHNPGGANVADFVPKTANLDYPVLFGFAILEVVPAIFYLTTPAVVQYISTHILENDVDFRNFATALFMTFFFFGSLFYRAFASIVSLPKKTVSFMCTACQTIAYLLLIPHKFSWNKKGYTYYPVICIFNSFIMVHFINSNIIITNQLADDNHKKYRWLVQGILYVVKNCILSLMMKLVYSTYDREKLPAREDANEEQSIDPSEENRYASEVVANKFLDKLKSWFNFRNLFITIYLVAQLASILATSLYKEHVFK